MLLPHGHAPPVLPTGGRQGFASDTAAAANALCLRFPPTSTKEDICACSGTLCLFAAQFIRDRSHLPAPLPGATHTDAAPREPAADMKQCSGPCSDHKSTAAAGQGRAWRTQPQPLTACTRSRAHSQEGCRLFWHLKTRRFATHLDREELIIFNFFGLAERPCSHPPNTPWVVLLQQAGWREGGSSLFIYFPVERPQLLSLSNAILHYSEGRLGAGAPSPRGWQQQGGAMAPCGLLLYCTAINLFACGSDICLHRKDKATHCEQVLLVTAALLNLFRFKTSLIDHSGIIRGPEISM